MFNQNNNLSIVNIFLIAIIIVVNLLFTFIPLLNILSYESSALNGVLFGLISGIYWLHNKNKNSIFNHLKFYSIISAIPLIILFISTLVCQQCPLSDGLLFYTVFALPSLIVGACLAELSIKISDHYKYLWFIFVFLIILLGFLPELYFNPQIYFYNPLFSYYPGVIYDENIQITEKLLLYRTVTVLFSILILAIFNIKNNFSKFWQRYVIFIVVVLYLSSYFVKSHLGFSTNLERIENELKGKIEIENLTILYPNNISVLQKNILILEHLYSLEKNIKLFGKFDEKITSIIFRSGAQKKELFGAQNADVTKPWLNQIYVNLDNYENSLNHELLHVFSKKFGNGLFNLPSNYNPGLVEGFATAFDNNYDNYDIDYLAFLAYNKGYKISLKNLFTDYSFFSNAPSISYIYAGSFIKYLSQIYSNKKITEYYSDPDFVKIFLKSIDKLEEDYYKYLVLLPFEFNPDKANLYFGSKPLIKKYCARAAAKELKNAWQTFNEEKFYLAEELFHGIYKYSNSYSAFNGIIQSKIKTEKFSDAINLLETEKKNFVGSSYFYNIEYLLAFLYSKEKNLSSSIHYYDSLIAQNPRESYYNNSVVYKTIASIDSNKYYNFINYPNLRREIIKKLVPEHSDVFLQYYLDNYLLEGKDNSDSTYVLNYQNEMLEIEEILKLKQYNSETYYQLGKFSFNNLDLERAISFTEIALKNLSEERRSIISEFLTKLKWMSVHEKAVLRN
ncbi:MAG: hypothetical protein KDC90_01830 [Ignavibacteriae bacterium]|nr:hypothetical protein [Ignavibacteriota bacterium]